MKFLKETLKQFRKKWLEKICDFILNRLFDTIHGKLSGFLIPTLQEEGGGGRHNTSFEKPKYPKEAKKDEWTSKTRKIFTELLQMVPRIGRPHQANQNKIELPSHLSIPMNHLFCVLHLQHCTICRHFLLMEIFLYHICLGLAVRCDHPCVGIIVGTVCPYGKWTSAYWDHKLLGTLMITIASFFM